MVELVVDHRLWARFEVVGWVEVTCLSHFLFVDGGSGALTKIF